jgi:hypothetical protein
MATEQNMVPEQTWTESAEANMSLVPPAQTNEAAGYEFRKKKWICLCQLLNDADASHKGTWEGRVDGRFRQTTEKVGANNACETATAQAGVDCKKCSCRLDKGEKVKGTQIKGAKKK